MSCFKFGEILIPASASVSDWAVIACDQYTSDRAYWDELGRTLKPPTALELVFPECYLGENDEVRIRRIIAKQKEYIESGVFRSVDGTVLVRRRTSYGNERWGLMCLIDLDEYDARPGSRALIRATEGLVPERIPPRVAIRKDCLVELPHAMLLIDDEKRSVIEPLIGSGERLYEGKLSAGGGTIEGYRITDLAPVKKALDDLLARSEAKYGQKLLFLVGDGNHSLATAKACVSESEPLSRYALVEVVNIYDEGLKFEPIHRVVFGVDNARFIKGLTEITASQSGNTVVYDGGKQMTIPFPDEPTEGVAAVQKYIDGYLASCGGRVDYIHGTEELKRVAGRTGGVGIMLKAIDKGSFFKDVVERGALPRKTFSMGEADEKRYYMEARYIKSK